MKVREAGLVLVAIGLFGCSHPDIYRNRAADAVSESRTVSIRRMPAKNQAFSLFRVGEEGMALLPRTGSYPASARDVFHTAVIFGPKELAELRDTCVGMVKALDAKQVEGVDLVQYRLVSNTEETVTSSSAVITPYGAASGSETRRGHRILFELQLTKDASDWWGPVAAYSFRGTEASISLDDLRKFSEDLQPK